MRVAARIATSAFCLTLAAVAPAGGQSAPARDSGTVKVGGSWLYYEAAGRGTPVVFIHGGNLDRRLWDEQFSRFAREYRVVRYDVRGFGRSGGGTAPFASHEDLYALLRALGVGRAHLVGLSLGGRIAIDFALTHPEMVRSLVLSGPGLSGFSWSREEGPWVDSLRAATGRRDSLRLVELWLAHPYMRPVMERPELAPRIRQLARENASSWMQPDTIETELAPRAASRLRDVRAPTLLLVGSRDVPDIQRIVDTLAASIPGARKVVLPGAGHILNVERQADFDRLLAAWLRAH